MKRAGSYGLSDVNFLISVRIVISRPGLAVLLSSLSLRSVLKFSEDTYTECPFCNRKEFMETFARVSDLACNWDN